MSDSILKPVQRAINHARQPAPRLSADQILIALIVSISATAIVVLVVAANIEAGAVTRHDQPRCVRIAGAIDLAGKCRP